MLKESRHLNDMQEIIEDEGSRDPKVLFLIDLQQLSTLRNLIFQQA